jgi:hypothetical protein
VRETQPKRPLSNERTSTPEVSDMIDTWPAYVKDLVSCPHCRTKQIVHLLPSAPSRTASELLLEVISCAKCTRRFAVRVADKIIDGPFAVEP